MDHRQRRLVAIVLVSMVGANGCSSEATSEEQEDAASLATSRGEHDRDDRGSDEHRGGEDEESGTESSLNESYDHVRNGVRLVLTYKAQRNSFDGTVENTTNEPLRRVRVEVHLSSGRELGPTTPIDLAAGEQENVTLAATDRDFDGWTAHAEVGEGEHGQGEGEGEHGGRQERGEHDGDH